ncbi:MAG: alpha/beta hydrolase [Anaerolineales bacterium]|nr:alpha/beta hydrolase [Anaerolineales bacterium]
MDNAKIIYLHGSDSSSQSGKARQFAEKFQGMKTPDFTGSFDERMNQLYDVLGKEKGWTIIGSSYGGLMATVFASENPKQVRKLVLLAPAILKDENGIYIDPVIGEPLQGKWKHLQTISVPTVIVHGNQDDVVPLEPVRKTAEELFSDVEFIVVDDGHRLQKAFSELNWEEILE